MKKNRLILFLVILFFVQCSATPKKRSFGEVVDDNVVALKLRTKLVKDKVVKANQIKVKVWKGTAKLSGEVDSQTQINRAIEIAEQQTGVKEVKAYLILKDTPGVTLAENKTENKSSKLSNPFKKIFPKKSQASHSGNSANSVVVTDLNEENSNSKKISDLSTSTNVKPEKTAKGNSNKNDKDDFEEIKY